MSQRTKPQPLDFSSMKYGLKRLMKEILQYRGQIIVVLVATVLSTLFSILGPRELGKATTTLFNGLVAQVQGTGTIDFALMGRILLGVIAIYVVSSIFGIVQGYVMTTVTETVAYRLRQQMMAKINRLPMSYFESQPIGETLSRIVNDVDTLGASLSQSASQLLTAIATMIGIAVIMFSINWLMALAVLLIVPISIVSIRFLTKRSQSYFREQQSVLGQLTGYVEEAYSGQQVVKAFNQEEEMSQAFAVENERMRQSAWRSQFYSGVMFPFMRFLGNAGYIFIVLLGAYLAALGQIRVGDIQAFTQYVNRFTQPITQIASIVNLLQSMSAASERVFDFLDEEEESQTEGHDLDVAEVTGAVDFQHVEFGYLPNQIIIQDFSADVEPGQKVALVGPTGAGKSTMVKLLMRFYDVNDGCIRLDGVNVNQYSRQSYQQTMAMVLQDTWLYKDTIMENIRYGRLDATDEEVIEAAKAARVHHFIMGLPGGYQFELNEDASNISEGQQQLLTIARAFIADRPVLILDEATSSVDTRTEALIQEAMENLMRGRTSFVIAHRLSTIKDADLILYMEDGDVVEQGDHESLMALSGRYANLYNSQFAS